jgi:hypothetical protein
VSHRLDALKRIEARSLPETEHRTREICGRLFRHAIATRRAGMAERTLAMAKKSPDAT